jgi:hypothetical protein
MTRAEIFERLKASLTSEQSEKAANLLTLGQKVSLATLDAAGFPSFYQSLTRDQRDKLTSLLTSEQSAWIAALLGKTPSKGAAMEPIEAIAKAIPSHLPKGSGGPWRIEQSTLDMFNDANATTYTLDAMPRGGYDVAVWLLRRIESDIGDSTPSKLVLGYLVGWHNPDPALVAKWTPKATAILATAQRFMYEPAGATTLPPTTLNLRPRRYTPWGAFAFFGGSMLAILLIAGGGTKSK